MYLMVANFRNRLSAQNLIILLLLLQIKNCCSRRHRSQSLLTSTSTEASGSFGKPKRESVIVRIKEMIPILKVFFPLTIYWAISYQRSSTWILQGVMMDCRLGILDVPPGITLYSPTELCFNAPPSISTLNGTAGR